MCPGNSGAYFLNCGWTPLSRCTSKVGTERFNEPRRGGVCADPPGVKLAWSLWTSQRPDKEACVVDGIASNVAISPELDGCPSLKAAEGKQRLLCRMAAPAHEAAGAGAYPLGSRHDCGSVEKAGAATGRCPPGSQQARLPHALLLAHVTIGWPLETRAPHARAGRGHGSERRTTLVERPTPPGVKRRTVRARAPLGTSRGQSSRPAWTVVSREQRGGDLCTIGCDFMVLSVVKPDSSRWVPAPAWTSPPWTAPRSSLRRDQEPAPVTSVGGPSAWGQPSGQHQA
jgi:hypothetical protein